MMKLTSIRASYFLGFAACLAIFLYSLYLQFNVGIQPCALCVLQRIVLVSIGLVFFLGSLFRVHKIAHIALGLLTTLLSVLGVALAGRQVWIQHFPGQSGDTCGASLQYMLKVLPFTEVLKNIFQGSAECTQIGWRFLSISLSEWSLFWFVIFLILSLWQLTKKV